MKNKNNNGKLTLMKKHEASFKSRTKIVLGAIMFICAMVVGSAVFADSHNAVGKSVITATLAGAAAVGTPEELEKKNFLDKVTTEVKSLLEKETEPTKKELLEIKNGLKILSDAAKDNLEVRKEVERLGAEFKALQEQPKKIETKSNGIKGALMSAFVEKKSEIDAMIKAGKLLPMSVEVKAAVDISVTNTIEAGPTAYSVISNTGIISKIRKRTETYLANVSFGSLSGDEALWIEELDEQGVPIFIPEGASATQLSVRYEERTKNVKEIAVFGKVTLKMMNDLPQLVSYISNNILKRMDIVVEDQLFSGDDTGDNLKGLNSYATAFSVTGLTLVKTPNEWDVLTAMATQVELAFGMPSGVFVNPATIQAMKAVKNTQGEPLWKDYVDIDGNGAMSVSGMKILPTTAMAAGTFLGGDLSVVNVLDRETLSIQIGLDGSDFIKRKKTMLASRRLVQFVSANDTKTIVKGTFSTAITALTAV
jgi:HK97 family phage major capsid protein